MKKLILVILLIATLIALVGCESVPVEVEPRMIVSVQEYEDLIERIGELEQELGNKTSDLQEQIDELSLLIDNLQLLVFTDVFLNGTLVNLDDCDYQLLIVTNRRTTDDGYEYQLREVGDDSISDEWFYSDDFLSIDEYTVAIIYGEEVILVDLD